MLELSLMSRIFINGDSITYGYWDDRAGGWGNRLKLTMMKSRDCAHEVVNFALGNQTIDKIVKRLPGQLAPYGRARSLGVLMLGGSDSVIRKGEQQPQVPIETFQNLLPELGKIFTESRITPLFVVGPYPVDETRCNPSFINGDRFSNERGQEYSAAVKRYADSIDAPSVGLDSIWTYPMEEILSFDGVHPSAKGHEIIAREVSAAVLERLASPLLSYTVHRE
jgi:lysophospholipase L1-like esterase